MPQSPVPQAIADFLDAPNLCVMAVLRPMDLPTPPPSGTAGLETTACW